MSMTSKPSSKSTVVRKAMVKMRKRETFRLRIMSFPAETKRIDILLSQSLILMNAKSTLIILERDDENDDNVTLLLSSLSSDVVVVELGLEVENGVLVQPCASC